MTSNAFVSSILMVLSASMITYYHFKEHFSGAEYFKEKAYTMREEIEGEYLKRRLAENQLEDLRQHVAVVLPDLDYRGLDYEQRYPYRNLASITAESENEMFRKLRSEKLFERANREFGFKNFRESNRIFKSFVEKYPTSSKVIKAYHLYVEGLYQVKDFEGMVEVTEQMVSLFPGDELTGHTLLRLVSVYEHQERDDEAYDILEVVIKSFKNGPLKRLALQKKRSLR